VREHSVGGVPRFITIDVSGVGFCHSHSCEEPRLRAASELGAELSAELSAECRGLGQSSWSGGVAVESDEVGEIGGGELEGASGGGKQRRGGGKWRKVAESGGSGGPAGGGGACRMCRVERLLVLVGPSFYHFH
jgi:hypothetical protein